MREAECAARRVGRASFYNHLTNKQADSSMTFLRLKLDDIFSALTWDNLFDFSKPCNLEFWSTFSRRTPSHCCQRWPRTVVSPVQTIQTNPKPQAGESYTEIFSLPFYLQKDNIILLNYCTRTGISRHIPI
jgi:hypothetical protein